MDRFYYGVAYYPEHWGEEVRKGDPVLFRKAGFNVVRMGEFAWDRIEPEPGRFDFSLFDETIESLAREGIATIFCTPTAAAPRWLTHRHPEVLRVDAQGQAQLHGSRQHMSHFSPVFREYSRRITHALAEHFKGNPNVVGWQTDNEFHCHFSQDHSEAAQRAFRDFLRERYGDSIDALNQTWGTAFWSQNYSDFEQIETPRSGRPTCVNPAQALDYQRFLSWGVTLFQREQINILRAANPEWWITHNGWFRSIDYRGDFTKDLDFLSYDSYPLFQYDPGLRASTHAFNLDYMRSFAGNFMVMEHQAGAGGQEHYMHDTPEPGELRRMVYASIARGADGVLFFRERSCPFGAEQYWRGVIDHDNVPRRLYQEASLLGNELRRVGPLVMGTHVAIDVAVSGGDFVALHGHEPVSHGLPNPRQCAEGVHQFLYRQGHAVGCVHPSDDLKGIRMYFLTHFTAIEDTWVENLMGWVEAGGILVIGARSGTKDENGNVTTSAFPGVLSGVAGVHVEEYGRQNRPESRPLRLRVDGADVALQTHAWYESLVPVNCTEEGFVDGKQAAVEVVGRWESRHLSGKAAITRHAIGRGAVYYVGTYFDDALLKELCRYWRLRGELPVTSTLPDAVERVMRQSDSRKLTFLINHNDATVTLDKPPRGYDLLRERQVEGALHLEPYDVAVICEEEA